MIAKCKLNDYKIYLRYNLAKARKDDLTEKGTAFILIFKIIILKIIVNTLHHPQILNIIKYAFLPSRLYLTLLPFLIQNQ